MIKAAFLNNHHEAGIKRVFGARHLQRLGQLADLRPGAPGADNFDAKAAGLADVEVLFSTWGMPTLSSAQIAAMPRLRAVFYAAGSVKGFARPFLEAGVEVISAWAANAVPVAEFTVAQILLSCKGYFRNTAACRSQRLRRSGKLPAGPGVYGEKVALVGAGMIGRKVVELLKPFNLRLMVVDPHLDVGEAAAMGVEIVPIEQAFAEALVVSNHLPNLESLRKVIDYPLFASMRPGATFINTGRGAQVDERGLLRAFRARTDLTALLDVTDPEPPRPRSPLYRLTNIQLSSHIAGSLGDEVARMADYVLEDFETWLGGGKPKYSVSLEMLEKMA